MRLHWVNASRLSLHPISYYLITKIVCKYDNITINNRIFAPDFVLFNN